jgi:hypothetical protein
MKLPQITDEIFYGIIGACVLYLIVMYILQKVKMGLQRRNIQKAKVQYTEAKIALDEEKKKLIDSISLIYGLEQANYVAMGRMWVGMPMSLLMVAKGKANNIRQTVGVDSIAQTWLYMETDRSTGKSREKMEVMLVNNEVSGWKEFA